MFKQFFSKPFVFSLVMLLITLSCVHDPPDVTEMEAVCFQREILPVFQNSCAVSGCHSGGGDNEAPPYSTYGEIMTGINAYDAHASKIYQAVTGRNMEMMPPAGPLPQNVRIRLWLWIQQGAQETSCQGEPTDGQPEFACFSRDILPVLVNSCAIQDCHSAQSAKEKIVITSYQTLMNSGIVKAGKPSDSKLYKVITASSSSEDIMPPKPYSPLTKALTDTIASWIRRGAPDEICQSLCDTTGNMTWSGRIQKLTSLNCTSCHSGNTPSGGLKLSTYAEVVNATKNGRLLQAIKRTAGVPAMPPSVALSACDVRKMELWKNQNYLQ